MSHTEQIANRISECLDRCRASGFTLATLVLFLDEMRANGESKEDVQHVDGMMRYILKNILIPAELLPVDFTESPTGMNPADTTKMAREQPQRWQPGDQFGRDATTPFNAGDKP